MTFNGRGRAIHDEIVAAERLWLTENAERQLDAERAVEVDWPRSAPFGAASDRVAAALLADYLGYDRRFRREIRRAHKAARHDPDIRATIGTMILVRGDREHGRRCLFPFSEVPRRRLDDIDKRFCLALERDDKTEGAACLAAVGMMLDWDCWEITRSMFEIVSTPELLDEYWKLRADGVTGRGDPLIGCAELVTGQVIASPF